MKPEITTQICNELIQYQDSRMGSAGYQNPALCAFSKLQSWCWGEVDNAWWLLVGIIHK